MPDLKLRPTKNQREVEARPLARCGARGGGPSLPWGLLLRSRGRLRVPRNGPRPMLIEPTRAQKVAGRKAVLEAKAEEESLTAEAVRDDTENDRQNQSPKRGARFGMTQCFFGRGGL